MDNERFAQLVIESTDYNSETGKDIPGSEITDKEHAFITRLKQKY